MRQGPRDAHRSGTRGRRRVWTVLVALSIGALTFVYRFNTLGGPLAGFDNEHFFQIVRAEAMLDGELPLRDYADSELRSLWPPLTYAASAMAMRTMGRSLRSEAVLTVGMLAIGAAALCWTAAVMAQGIAPAALTTVLAVGLGPTLYNYPKIVIYVFAVVATLAYARRPNVWRLLGLALVVVVGTLYRHDHAVYLAFSSLVLLLLVHRRRAVRPLIQCALFVLAGLMPGLVFAQQHGGLVTYIRECLGTSRREVARTAKPPVPLHIDVSQPLLVRAPPPLAHIAIRWTPAVTAETRALAERELRLVDARPREDDRNWSYAVGEPSPARLAAIVRDPRVEDTDGINRRTFALTVQPGRGGLFGWRVAPGILQEANATPWLQIVGWSVVLVSMTCLAWPPLRRAVERPEVPAAALASVSALGVLLLFVFLRTPVPSRLPDASVPVVVLGAWLLAAIPRAARSRPRPLRAAIGVMFAATVALSIVSVGVVGEVPAQVGVTGAREGAAGVSNRWRTLWMTLGHLPESTSAIDETLGAAASYLRRCTRSSDRLLVADYVPELYYFARRRVAAGQMVFFGGFYTSEQAQLAAMRRWGRQSVPIALIQPPERFEEEFGDDYRLLAEYLRSRYRRAGRLAVRHGIDLDVWIDPRRDRGSTDPQTGLPCVVD